MPQLTVLTYNIHHATGMDGRLDVDRVAAVIGAANADLIGLQEVDRGYGVRSEHLDLLDLLAGELGMTAVFGGTMPAEPPPGGQPAAAASERLAYGNALLTPHPVRSWRNHELPCRADVEPRRLLDVEVDTPIGPVRVGVTHLSYERAQLRRGQVAAVCRHLRAGASGVPRVVMGDFNDTPRSGDLAGFWPAYVDAWAEAGDGKGCTIDAGAPSKRIDYVLHDAGLIATAADTPVTLASDHLPVRVVLKPARMEDADAHRTVRRRHADVG